MSSDEIAILTLGPFISSTIALVVAPIMSKRMGKRQAALLVYGLAIALAPMAIAGRLLGLMPLNGSPALLPTLFFFTVIEVGLIVTASILMSSMVADTVEESQLVTGRRSEGVFFAARSFIQKSVHGIGVLAATAMLTAIGFPEDAKPGAVSADIVTDLGLVYIPVLMVLYVISLAFVAGYRISRAAHEANLEKLASPGVEP